MKDWIEASRIQELCDIINTNMDLPPTERRQALIDTLLPSQVHSIDLSFDLEDQGFVCIRSTSGKAVFTALDIAASMAVQGAIRCAPAFEQKSEEGLLVLTIHRT